MQDVEWDLNRELRLRAETKIGKARIESEIDKVKRENVELKESLAMAETLRIKHQEMIAQYEFANRERDRAQALNEEYKKGEESGGNKIADAVKNLQRAVSQKIQNVLMKKSVVIQPKAIKSRTSNNTDLIPDEQNQMQKQKS